MNNHFYQVVSVSVAEFPETAQCSIHDTAATQIQKYGGLMMVNRGSDDVEYSFDGTEIHGVLKASGPEQALAFDGIQLDRIWFQRASGTPDVAVRAWVQKKGG